MPTAMKQLCPRTAVLIPNDKLMEIINEIMQDPLHKLVFPVMIRDDHNHVYELTDLVKWFFANKLSPTSRAPFPLEELEPVMYNGFKGYQATVDALKFVTENRWRPKDGSESENQISSSQAGDGGEGGGVSRVAIQ